VSELGMRGEGGHLQQSREKEVVYVVDHRLSRGGVCSRGKRRETMRQDKAMPTEGTGSSSWPLPVSFPFCQEGCVQGGPLFF
jgi:hypothetical protein